MSAIHPQLKQNGVRLIGVGLEELGVEEFVKGQFFSGELFIDLKQETYTEMKAKRHGYFSILPKIFNKKGRDAMNRAKQVGVDGDLKGDGFLMGGTLVVSAGGKEKLLEFKQDGPPDHVENSEVLRVLGISSDSSAEGGAQKPAEGAACEDEVCSM